jgi:uncharacterized protein (DUF3820 family)
MIAQFLYKAAILVRPAPLEDDGRLVWLAGTTLPDGSMGELMTMKVETAKQLRDQLNAALMGL